MSPFAVSCVWCLFQITLLCAAGVALSLLIVRRYPASSAAVMSATAGVVLLTTAFVPIQIPHWALPPRQVPQPGNVPALAPVPETGEVDTKADGPQAAVVDFHALLSRVRSAIHAGAPLSQSPTLASRCVTTVVALGILVGSLRMCVAFFSVWRIRRNSLPIADDRADGLMKALACSMRCRLPVRLAVSLDVGSAAVMGWLHPLIVLPTDWKTWPTDQLRAVLAHELAHVVRRDYLWRAIGTIARAVHYYHPLAHWLLGRLAYSQEVAADQLAAKTLGSRSQYFKALSRLAIRQDDLLRFHREPILLPTSSSHLIRRINMLRTKERTQSRGMNLAVRLVAVSTVVLLAVVTTALRGLAEPTDDQPTTPTAQTEDVQNSTEAMFQYTPLDPAIIGDNESGIFVLRVGEMLKRDSIRPMIRGLNQAASAACKSLFGSSELAEFDLEMIDYVVGQAQVGVQRLTPTPEIQQTSRLTIGSNYWIVRFNRDVSSWQQWVRKYVPAAEELQHGETTYFQFPAIPAIAIGPMGFRVAARDSHTLVFALDGELFWEQVEATNTVVARWTDEWKELDGGLFSLIATDKSIEVSVEESNSPVGNAMNQVFDNTQQIGYGADWNDLTNQMCVKLHFFCSGREEAKLVETGIDSAMSLGRAEANAELEKVPQDGSSAEESRARRASELLDNSETRTTTRPDGTVVVQLETSFTLPLEELFDGLSPGEEEVARREPATSATK